MVGANQVTNFAWDVNVHFGASAMDGRSSSGCLGPVDVGCVEVVTDSDVSRPLGGSGVGSLPLSGA